MSNDHIAAACAAVTDQVGQVMQSTGFRLFIEGNPPKPGDLIVFNNSFLYRDGIKTVKSKKYLCVRVGSEGPALPVYVLEPGGINTRFKRIVVREGNDLAPQPLDACAPGELNQLGLIVKALVGEIGDDEPAEVPIEKVKNCSALMYEPRQAEVAEVIDGLVSVNRLDDVDLVWQAIKEQAHEANFELEEKFVSDFETKFAELREAAHRPVDVSKASAETSILGEAIRHLDEQIADYSSSLAAYLSDPDSIECLNDLLRISYNFADGAQELMNLVIGISDMKPVIFWLTLAAQSDLADRFGDLPFSLVGKAKPSFGRYRSVIAGARNQNFHNIFSFGRPFRVRLTGDAFQAAELRLFREYASRKDPALDYADRKLVDLLESFTRAVESPVPMGFWETNLDVMQAVATVVRSVRDALLLLSSSE